jgi:hypothetical protein
VRTTEELLGRKSSRSGQENRDYLPWESVALTTQHPLSEQVGITSPTSGGRSVGINVNKQSAILVEVVIVPVDYISSNNISL